jgi:hypothetical protein
VKWNSCTPVPESLSLWQQNLQYPWKSTVQNALAAVARVRVAHLRRVVPCPAPFWLMRWSLGRDAARSAPCPRRVVSIAPRIDACLATWGSGRLMTTPIVKARNARVHWTDGIARINQRT